MRKTLRGPLAASILVASVAAHAAAAPAARLRPTPQDESTASGAVAPDDGPSLPALPAYERFERLAALLADDRRVDVLHALREDLDAFGERATDARDAALLAGLIDFARGGLRSEDLGDLPARILGGVELPESPGAHDLRARLAVLTGDVEGLAPLDAWQMVGPFENERGRAMRRTTPPEKDPVADAYDGKVTDVEWRELPAPARDGVHRIDRFVYPREQFAVVARTWVRAERALDAYLLVGASEEFEAWVRGDAVLEARDAHTFGEDGHTARVTLERGWNEIALKVGAQEGSCMFSARLVDAGNGAPLRLESRAAPPSGVEAARLGGRAPSASGAPEAFPPGVRRTLARLAAAGGLGPGEMLARAAIDAAANAVPKAKRPGYAAAQAALDAQPDSLAAVLLVLGTMRVEDALDVEEDVNPWLAVLRDAITRHGDRTIFLLAYAEHAAQSQGLPLRAQELCERAVAANPASLTARWALLASLNARGLGALADARREELVRDEALRERPTLASTLAASYPDADPRRRRLLELAADAGDLRAETQLARLDLPESRAAQRAARDERLRAAVDRDPGAIGIRIRHGRTRLAEGDSSGALALLDEAVALTPHDPDVRGWRARARVLAGDLEGAVQDLERAMDLDRSDTEELRLLEHLRARLDAGAASTGEAPFHEAFREPLADVLARHPEKPALANEFPREALLERTVVEVGADGTARRYRRSVQRILGTRGVRDLDARSFRAWPGQEEVRVLSARVLSPDGTVREARTGRTGARGFLTVDLPPLAVGDVVDLEWRRDDLVPSVFGSYFGLDAPLVSDPSLPQRESEVVVLERDGVELSYHVTGEPTELGVDVRRWNGDDGARFRAYSARGYAPSRREAYEPPPAESLPRVQASTYGGWDAFGTWWWSLIDEEITGSDEMRAKVVELTDGLEDPLDQLRAIYEFVVTDVRYNAWEFGIHGYQPYSAPVIFSRRFGDCKDKAILLKAMLAEVGIEAWPVVIDAQQRREEEDLSLALVGHFNHCIAYVPAQDGVPEMFLDGTARLHPLDVLPDSDAGADVLVVRSDGVERREVPFKSADENLVADAMTIDLSGAAPSVRMVRAPRGRWDPRERMRFEGDDAERDEQLERLLTSIFGALAGPARAEHPDYQDLGTPLEIVMEFEPEDIGRGTGTGRELPSTFAAQDLLSSVASETERTTDVLLDVPWSSEQSIEYVLPPGARVLRAPRALDVASEDLEYARTVSEPEVDPGGRVRVRIVERIAFRTHRVPVERYAAFRELARQIDDAQRETLDYEL
ncbi:MAG: DUF3857 domain-containing protein [Planctomycetota bacterium]